MKNGREGEKRGNQREAEKSCGGKEGKGKEVKETEAIYDL